MIKKVDHIAVVVEDLAEARRFWVDALGLTLDRVDSVPAEAVDIAFLPVGDSEIELLQPTDPESGVAKYLAKRGAGLHHLCFEVDDIEAVLDRLRAAAVPLITETAKVAADGKKYAFVHPKGTGGVLVELYQLV
ncbi:MAG: methylmalonyl-CoA epimerase [Chloroflexi bacterium]|jgi:methylmalonyl-CoA/ethylmalonyl-CoA epimerase|nr:methylmalonyl-CoA epimerase [Chloroflexota bacterium]